MKVLITGVCGFAGSTLALHLREHRTDLEIVGVDNFIRPGSEINRRHLVSAGVAVIHADLRMREDVDRLPRADWVIDAAANPSVLAGTGASNTSSRLLMQHNLTGTINLLEWCHAHGAGLILLSTSRVYSIEPLAALKLDVRGDAFRPSAVQAWPEGIGTEGVAETCSTATPVSLYGASKVCSEILALEYGAAFEFPVWINRLGVLAGAGQFGRADQGIFSFWIHASAARRRLTFTGFGGQGFQVRDCLHPKDLAGVLVRQMVSTPGTGGAVTNFSGGVTSSMSLRQLDTWCVDRFGSAPSGGDPADRPFDLPWVVLDASAAAARWNWQPVTPREAILDEIARHAEAHPEWLEWTAG